ncbi:MULTISPECIES: CPXCG motif-containing cysteine-rich protein [Alishewanella]|uniref:Zn-ribbon protein n=1 Tax=Alishewanella jeotgali KCTC 22429 TaxID=1129374 RepID=H3ZAR3_9ALTE|nr:MULTISPECIES: CPXCG motif-containing cysteine-rich protein [Alishewanella]EHR42027.1 hypothetical protein AJE_02081 [Alishewanella jeotgali KCTC 22429]MCT8125717.1 CPXCG motif-containing cysteine-rich protein [Alishewanella sp. BS5-314]OCW97835.1 hypothetical protein A9165_04090 [Alishewanella sp. HH-ZS]
MQPIFHSIQCPFCGHSTDISVEATDEDQDYTEDCSNCCNPMHIRVHIDELRHRVQIFVDADDEQYY